MTKTKSQKARSAMKQKMQVSPASGWGCPADQGLARVLKSKQKPTAKQMRAAKREWSFLNGNSFSFLNTSAAVGGNTGKQRVNRVTVPVSSGFSGLSSKASIVTNNGVTRVRHSEYVADISPSSDYDIESFPINPGTESLFPWLASIAVRYESYQFRNLRFRYETQAPTSTNGTVILSVDYNPGGSVPTSKVELLAMESAVRCPTWGSVVHSSLVHNLTKRKSYYIRNGEPVTDADLFDTGSFLIAVEGAPLDMEGNIGELYVDYEVDLITPILTNLGVPQASGFVEGTNTASDPNGGHFPLETNLVYEGIESVIQAGPGISLFANTGTGLGDLIGGIKFLQSGRWMISCNCDGLAPGAFAVDDFSFGYNVPTNSFANLTPGGLTAVYDSTSRYATACFVINVEVSGPQPDCHFAWANTEGAVSPAQFVTKLYLTPYGGRNVLLLSSENSILSKRQSLRVRDNRHHQSSGSSHIISRKSSATGRSGLRKASSGLSIRSSSPTKVPCAGDSRELGEKEEVEKPTSPPPTPQSIQDQLLLLWEQLRVTKEDFDDQCKKPKL